MFKDDFIVLEGDTLVIQIIPPAMVPETVAPMPIISSKRVEAIKVFGKPCCVLGDENSPLYAKPLTYTAPPFVIPGTGMLQINLTPDHFAKETMLDGKPVLLAAEKSSFPVLFKVMTPAQQTTPKGLVFDPVLLKIGRGSFRTTNLTLMGK